MPRTSTPEEIAERNDLVRQIDALESQERLTKTERLALGRLQRRHAELIAQVRERRIANEKDRGRDVAGRA